MQSDNHEALQAGLGYLGHGRIVPGNWEPLAPEYSERLEAAFPQAGIDGDVLGALVRHHEAGRIELFTSSATHAYLPGLSSSPASIRAQLRLGLRGFERMSGVRPMGL